jgi:integration host factor subunit alpha
MTKADIVERIYERAKSSKKDASDVVDLVFELIKARLEAGEKVKLSGFGNFVVNAKRPRKGRNPQTGEEIIISGRRVLSFKASQVLKNAINDGVRPADGAASASSTVVAAAGGIDLPTAQR